MSSSPSSPAFPSLTALFSQKPQLNDERHSAATGNDSTKPSQTVLLQDPAAEEYGVTGVIQSSAAAKAAAATAGADEIPKRKVARKSRALKDNDGDVEAAVKKPRKPRAKKAEVVDDVEKKDSPAPKRRVKRNKTEEQTKLPRSRITKPSIKPTGEKWTRLNETEAAHHNIATAIPKAADVPDSPLENGLLLQEAVRRRLNWTPPRMTNALLGLDSEASNDINNIMGKELLNSSLLEKFGYNSGDDTRDIARAAGTTGLRKRKLIELVTTNSSAQRKTPKPKAPPKKKRTITELAIAAYTNDTGTLAATAPLLQYFPYKDATDAAGEVKDSKVPPQARSGSSTKHVVKNSKSAKAISKDPILLSPKSALRQVSKQDFVFGTSSQLAQENSPSLLRDLHQAMRESNKVDDPFAVYFESSKCPEPNKETIGRNAGRRLWSAASYGPNVKAVEVDVVDLVELPDAVKAKTSTSVVRLPGINQYLPSAKDDEWLQVDEDNSSHLEITKITNSIPQVVKSSQLGSHLQLEHSSGPNNPSTSEPKSKSQTKSSKCMKSVSEKPNFNSYTSIQLAKEIESYRFKPVKSREQMITLLERCWEGKQRVALGNVGINTAPPKSPVEASQDASNTVAAAGSPVRGLRKENKSPEPSKRPAGRPRKIAGGSSQPSKTQANDVSPKKNNHLDTSASCSPIPLVLRPTPQKQRKRGHSLPEEIEDSDSPLTPSPPRRATPHRRTPSLTLRASLSPTSLSPASLSPPASSIADSAAIHDDMALHTHITRAIVTAPRAAPPTLVPSWHEKILLYDPIVLEDLTAWLNTGALDRVGWDGEISPAQVKRWCIAKGVCCLWRETLRGKARQRL
jgi:hypothetical protein